MLGAGPADNPDMTRTPLAIAATAVPSSQPPTSDYNGRHRALETELAPQTCETIAIVAEWSKYGRHAAPAPAGAEALIAGGLPLPRRAAVAPVAAADLPQPVTVQPAAIPSAANANDGSTTSGRPSEAPQASADTEALPSEEPPGWFVRLLVAVKLRRRAVASR